MENENIENNEVDKMVMEDFESLLIDNIGNFKFCKNEKELYLKKRIFLNSFNEFILMFERRMKK